MDRSPRDRPPDIPGFRILSELGRGGMGVVYLAEQPSLGRQVALKVLAPGRIPSERQIERFRREAAAAARLAHPNIVPVFASGETDGLPWFVMPCVEGQSLQALLDAERQRDPARTAGTFHVRIPTNDGAPPAPESSVTSGEPSSPESPHGPRHLTITGAVRLAAKAARALHAAHEAGIVHRDVKPSNIVVDASGEPLLLDFGLALEGGSGGLTLTGELLGTPWYMSPEQTALGDAPVDRRSDVFSLGVTLYEMLTLDRPFGGDNTGEVLKRIATEDPKPPSDRNRAVPRDLDAVVLKALAKAPADRYAAALDFARDLEAFLDGRRVTARRATWLRLAARRLARHPRVAAALGVLLAAAVATTVLYGRSRSRLNDIEEQNRRLARQIEELTRGDPADPPFRAPDAAPGGSGGGLLDEARRFVADNVLTPEGVRRLAALGLGEDDQSLLLRAEAAILEGRTAEAERAFRSLADSVTPSPEHPLLTLVRAYAFDRAGAACSELGRHEAARDLCARARSTLDSLGTAADVAATVFEEARRCALSGLHNEALELCRDAAARAAVAGHQDLLARIRTLEGELLLRLRRPAEARSALEAAETAADGAPASRPAPRGDNLRVLILDGLARTARQLGDPDTARRKLEEAIRVAEQRNLGRDLGRNLRDLAETELSAGRTAEARRLLERALEAQNAARTAPRERIATMQLLAEAARRSGDTAAAQAWIARAQRLRRGPGTSPERD